MAIHDIYPSQDQRRYVSSRPVERFSTAGASAGVLDILWRRKLLILLSILVCLGVGIVYVAATPPRYAATAAMLIDPRLGKTVGSDPNVPGFVADTAAIDSQIKLFTSQTVLSRVAAQCRLKDDPEFNGKHRSLLQRILHPALTATDGVDLKTLEDAITIKRPERTYVVEIDALARDSKKAAEIANAVTQAYIADQVSSRVGSAKEDTQYVSDKLDKLSVEIRDIDNKIESYKAKNKIIETSGLRSNEQQVSDLTKALGDARARESDTKARLSEIDRMAREGRLASSNEALRSLTIERLRQQQAETEQNVARLSKTLGARHPEMIEVRERQARVRELIRDELERVKNGVRGDYQAAAANEKQILAEIDQVKAQSSEMSRKLVPLDQMQRNRAVLRSSFDRFAQVNDTLAQQGAQSPPGRVIAVARPPVSPSQPKKTVVGLVSLSAGLFLGFAGALFAEGAGGTRVPPVVQGGPDRGPAPSEPTPVSKPRRRYWDDDDEV